MNNTNQCCLYREWRKFLKLLKAVLVVQVCLFKILLVFAKLVLMLS